MLRDDNNRSPTNGGKPRQRKLFGRSPWHRKTSRDSETSVSSSIRDMLRGPTPRGTPINNSQEDLGCSRYEWSEAYPGGVSPPFTGSDIKHIDVKQQVR
jgi:hypothetical protein